MSLTRIIVAIVLVSACSSPHSAPDADVSTTALAVFPAEVTIVVGATRGFRAEVAGDPTVTWKVVEATGGGTIDGDGAYVAPTVPGTFHVEVSSVTTPDLTATATVHVVAVPTHATFAAVETVTISGFQAGEMRLVDVDGDDDVDIISAYGGSSATSYGAVQLLKNDGTGAFTNVTDTDLTASQAMHPRDWAVADFNNDGRLDVAMADHGWDQPPFPGDQSRLFQQTVDGKLADVTATAMPALSSFTHNICAGDLDGDGDVDLLVTNLGPASNAGAHIYTNGGTGTFSNTSGALTPGTFTSCAIADLDNDGDLDVYLGNTQGTTAASDVVLLQANGAFSPSGTLPPRYQDASWATVDANAVDLDRDGWLDLVLVVYDANISKLGLQVLINRGHGMFADGGALLPPYPSIGGYWMWATPADLDGSGWPALVISGNGNEPRVYLHDGTKLYDSGMTFPGVWRLWPGDVDGDGDIDLVGHGFGDQLYLYRNQRTP